MTPPTPPSSPQVVQLAQNGRTYTFTVEQDGAFQYWHVDSPGRPSVFTPCLVLGDEQPEFFRGLAD